MRDVCPQNPPRAQALGRVDEKKLHLCTLPSEIRLLVLGILFDLEIARV